MSNIGQRIVKLGFRQRPERPVGEARQLVDVRVREPRHQRLVGHGVAEAADHGGDLSVEQRRRDGACQVVENLDVLARGVEHLEDPAVSQELIKRAEIQTRGQGIYGGGLSRAGELDQAQLGPVGLLAHELGVDGDVRLSRQVPAKRGQPIGVGDERHGRG